MDNVRPAAVAGSFYPNDPMTLRREIKRLLDDAKPVPFSECPKAIIVPHAGLIYSGSVAATVYAGLANFSRKLRRVVLLSPNHRVALKKMVWSGHHSFSTPLGEVPVDLSAIEKIQDLDWVDASREAHRLEHGLEVHLPFLQLILQEFQVVPLIVGTVNPMRVKEVLETLWGGPETLIVISSDLSHFLPYDMAVQVDGRTTEAILNLNWEKLDEDDCCGRIPIQGLLQLAKEREIEPQLIDYRNSGDSAGSRDSVVGYGAYAFFI